MDNNDDDANWVDRGAPGGVRSPPCDANVNDDSKGEEVMKRSGNRTRKGKKTQDGKGNGKATGDGKVKGKRNGKVTEEGKGKGTGNGKGNGSLEQTPGGDDISRAVGLQLLKNIYEADSDREGSPERVYLEPDGSPAGSIPSHEDTDSINVLDGQYDSEHDSDVDIHMEDDVDAPYHIDLDGNVDMEWDGDHEDEEDEEAEDEDEEEDEHEHDDKEPWSIGQGDMVHTSADDVQSMVNDQPTMLPEQGQAMCEDSPRPQPPAPTPWAQTPEPLPRPRTPESHPLGGLEYLGLLTLQRHRPVVPTLREAVAAGNTWDVDVDQQLLGEWAGGDSLPNVPLPFLHLQQEHLDGSVGEE